jgi:hypothetical protein
MLKYKCHKDDELPWNVSISDILKSLLKYLYKERSYKHK